MNRILTPDVILTLTADQAACLVEMCSFVVDRVEVGSGSLAGSHIESAADAVFEQCAKQGVFP